MKKTWFKVENLADSEKKVLIYDEIGGWGIRAIDLINEINSGNTKLPLNVYINSPGGDLVEALAIFNAIKRYEGDTTAYVDGIAASAASYISMAFDKVVMPENTMMMIHDPISYAFGNADEMRETADLLDKFKNSILSGYADKSGKTVDDISALLSNETWLTAQEAVDMGFADEIIGAIEVVAMSREWNFKNAPESIIKNEAVAALEFEILDEEVVIVEDLAVTVENQAVDNSLVLAPSDPVVEDCDPLEIAKACTIAGVPSMIAGFLASGETVAQVKNKIIEIQAAKNSALEISSVKNLGSTLQAQNSVVNTSEIYARLNQKK